MFLLDFFQRKTKVTESGLLAGFVDNHCHLLPGVDDGIKEMDKTLVLLSMMENEGLSELWFTPHIMEDIPNETEKLKERFEEVKSLYKGSIKLNLAAEYMLDNLFEERLSAKDLLQHKDKSVLVECSFAVAPINIEQKFLAIKSAGYFPILAHPERYVYMEDKEYDRIKELGVKFQLNLTSLLGLYGNDVKKCAEELLEKGMYDCVGTDTHRIFRWQDMLEGKLKSKHIELLRKIVKN